MNINKFYDEYIHNYYPYRNNYVYKSLTKLIFKDYFNDLYNNIPSDLKKLFEKNEIPDELYDIILMSIGIRKNIVSSLTFWDKIIFLNNLIDFQKNKGSINLLKNILANYDNVISVYELYLIRENDMWFFKPVPIYINPLSDEIKQNLSFYEIYHKTPNFLINDKYLNNLYNTNNILLPFKVNLLLLDFMDLDTSFIIDDLMISSFMYTYRDKLFTIPLLSTTFELNISLLTYMWFYLVSEYFEYDWGVFPNNLCVHYNIEQQFPDITRVEQIIDEFKQIKFDGGNTRKLLDEFYAIYFQNKFETNRYNSSFITRDIMYNYIYNHNMELAIFLKEQLKINKKFMTQQILSELYYVLLRLFNSNDDELFKKYALKWLLYLPKLIISIEQTPEYKLIKELKPHHTELIQSEFSGIIIDNKFNSVPIDISIDIEMEAGPYTSSLVISDNFEFIEEE